MIKTHMFWAYGNFSNLEKIAASSFIKNGYDLNIWTYRKIDNAPTEASIRDANEILPESTVFLNLHSSYASFSDLFRYALLNKIGGLYVDTDVISVKSAKYLNAEAFLVTERAKNIIKRILKPRNSLVVNNNVIFNPDPIAGNLIALAYHYSIRFPKDRIHWSEIGPQLLTKLTNTHPAHGFAIRGPEFANSVNWWKCPHALLKPRSRYILNQNALFLHCYNEMWRRAGIDKNAPFPKNSLMSFFPNKYL
jgi:hypothetical protein